MLTDRQPSWKRLIRFVGQDGRIHFGEPQTSEDVVLVAGRGQSLEAVEIIGDPFGNWKYGKVLTVNKVSCD
jgi:hypothetical protein